MRLDYRPWLFWPEPLDWFCRTAVYVTRSYGGVGGGGREVFPYPKWASAAQRTFSRLRTPTSM